MDSWSISDQGPYRVEYVQVVCTICSRCGHNMFKVWAEYVEGVGTICARCVHNMEYKRTDKKNKFGTTLSRT